MGVQEAWTRRGLTGAEKHEVSARLRVVDVIGEDAFPPLGGCQHGAFGLEQAPHIVPALFGPRQRVHPARLVVLYNRQLVDGLHTAHRCFLRPEAARGKVTR